MNTWCSKSVLVSFNGKERLTVDEYYSVLKVQVSSNYIIREGKVLFFNNNNNKKHFTFKMFLVQD